MFRNNLFRLFNLKTRVINKETTNIKISGPNYRNTLTNILSKLNEFNLNYYNIESRISELNMGNKTPIVNFYLTYKSENNTDIFEKIKDIMSEINLKTEKIEAPRVPWFPVTIEELFNKEKLLFSLDNQLNKEHPSFSNKEYRDRREVISNNSKNHKMGQVIPNVEYTKDEIECWGTIYNKLKPLFVKYGCKEFNNNFKILEDEGIFSADFIPQQEDINNYLFKKTGFRMRPVDGIISQREYFETLAYRAFPATQYIRSSMNPFYTPEPDIVHEYLGHVSMFANKDFCDFSQKIGILSLGQNDQFINLLGAIYWYTIEFGVLFENGSKKFYGGGIASSVSEIENMSKCSELKKLDLINEGVDFNILITNLQQYYYYIDSFEELYYQFDNFRKRVKRDFNVYMNSSNTEVLFDRSVVQIEHK